MRARVEIQSRRDTRAAPRTLLSWLFMPKLPVPAIVFVDLDSAPPPRLFDRGVRGWRAAAVIPEGTGLGLWLVKKILDIHGATIEFVEQADAGGPLNVFRIQFGS